MEYRELTAEEFADIQSRILYEDNHLLVFNKNVGEITQGDKTGDECIAETLKAFIAQRDGKPGKVFMGIPHRLDRPVSGICIMAKTSKALERMTAMFRDGEVHKDCAGIPGSSSRYTLERIPPLLVKCKRPSLSNLSIVSRGILHRDRKPLYS